jgi:hypothetical protein
MAKKGKGANTIRNVVGVLSMILAELVADGDLAANPVDGLARGKRPGRPPRRIEVPTPAEVEHSSPPPAPRRAPSSS